MPDQKPKPDTKAAEKRLRAAQDKALRAKLGPPLGGKQGLSDAALEQAAAVTELDEEAAGRYWDRFAPREGRGLLDAEAEG